MKLYAALCRQHIDRMFKKHWRIQGIKVPQETKAEKVLTEKGIPIYQPEDIIYEKRQKLQLDIVGIRPKPIPRNKNHPEWKETVCYFYRDNNALLEGIDQAKILTKSVEICEGLPEKIQIIKLPKDVNKKVSRIILSSHLFDAEQVKLPKIKDPLRPAWNFPRIYGISAERINFLLLSNLLQLCEQLADKNIVKERIIMNDAKFFVPLQKNEDLLQLELSADKLLLSSKPLKSLTTQSVENIDLPNIYPIKYTNTLVAEHFYENKTVYPIKKNVLKFNPHTIFVHFDPQIVKNLYEEEVTESQIISRSLMKSFTVAAAYARQKFGTEVGVLPEPVTVQCVQTDGRLFHFAMLQLNTLDLNDGGVKNIWYNIPRLPLFEACEYKIGKPVIEGYNPEVIKYLYAFYNNV